MKHLIGERAYAGTALLGRVLEVNETNGHVVVLSPTGTRVIFSREEITFGDPEPTVANLVEHVRNFIPAGVSVRDALEEALDYLDEQESKTYVDEPVDTLFASSPPDWACSAEQMVDRLRASMPEQFNTAKGSVIDALLTAVGYGMFDQPAKSAPVYVPGKSCTCGAQRVGVTKHYSYCDLGVTDVQEP